MKLKTKRAQYCCKYCEKDMWKRKKKLCPWRDISNDYCDTIVNLDNITFKKEQLEHDSKKYN